METDLQKQKQKQKNSCAIGLTVSDLRFYKIVLSVTFAIIRSSKQVKILNCKS